MTSAVVQVAYESLHEIAQRFMTQAESIQAATDQINRTADNLEPNWIGAGADAFFSLISSATLPALKRLVDALQTGSHLTADVAKLLRSAEEEAASVFDHRDQDAGITIAGSSIGSAVAGAGMNFAGSGAAPAGTTSPGGAPSPVAGGPANGGATPTINEQMNSILAAQPLNKEALMNLVQQASPDDKAAIIKDRALMKRLRDSLSGRELDKLGDELVNIPSIPEGKIRTAVGKLAVSERDVDANSAALVVKGKVKIYITETLPRVPNGDELLEKQGLSPDDYDVVYQPPANTKPIAIRKGMPSTPFGDGVILMPRRDQAIPSSDPMVKLRNRREITVELVHEINHAISSKGGNNDMMTRYENEFRAYWIDGGEFSKIKDPAKRAEKIRAHILEEYPIIKEQYNEKNPATTPSLKDRIDRLTTPSGNIDNRE